MVESEFQPGETQDSVLFLTVPCCLLELSSLVILIGLAEGQLSLPPPPFFSGLFTGDHVQKSSPSSCCGSGGGGGGEKGREAEEWGRAEREQWALLSGKAS